VVPENAIKVYWLDHENKRLWILIPKVASTSMRMTLDSGEKVSRETALEYKDYYTIVFTRHPWDRIVSALFSKLMDGDSFEERIYKWIHYPGRIDWMDMHVRPQSWFTEGFDIDFLGRFESIETHWKNLQKEIDVPDLQYHGKGIYRPGSWKDVDFDWSEIAHFYEQDCAAYL